MEDPGSLQVRVAYEEEPVAEVRVRGTRRRYWVGLRSRKVLGRVDGTFGMKRLALRLLSLGAGFVGPPLLHGALFGEGGTAMGVFFGFMLLLGIMVWSDPKSSGVMGIGK